MPTAEDAILLMAAYMVSPTRSRAKAAQDGLDIEELVAAHPGGLDLERIESLGRRLGVWDAVEPLLGRA